MARVCMLVTNDVSHDARVRKEARTLVQAGHHVRILAVRGDSLPDREEWDGVRVERVADPMSARGGALARKVGNLLRLASIQRAFLAHATETRCDAVHAHDLDTLWAGFRISRRLGVPLVYDAHELYSEATYPEKLRRPLDRMLSRLQQTLWRRHERRLIGRADVVITVNDLVGRELVERYKIEPPLIVMNMPTRSGGRVLPLPELPGVVLLYQGALIHERGLLELLDVTAQIPEVSLVIMGSGELASALRTRAEAPDLSGRVRIMDPVSTDDVVAVARSADVGVLPLKPANFNYVISAPNKLFDYMHAGLAIVASDLPFMRATLVECGCGVIFPAGDFEAMAEAIRGLAADPIARAAMRAASLAAAPRFRWETEGAKLVEAYGALLREGGAS
jgi:glycosyltransferase involved in cell wall biosynthesis